MDDRFKLKTRRILAWGIALPAACALLFGTIFGAVTSQMEVFAGCVTPLVAMAGTVLGYYFSKKVTEE